MSGAPITSAIHTGLLGVAALAAPVVLFLVVYDLRWMLLHVRAGLVPPWGAIARLGAAVLCHGGAAILLAKGQVWPSAKLTWWLHMTLDPGLTLYAIGLWDLFNRVNNRGRMAQPPEAA